MVIEKHKLLMKILVGAAWIDGKIQTEERDYLRHKAIANNLAEDKEIKSLLSEIVPVQATECYQWLSDYLGDNPSGIRLSSIIRRNQCSNL